MSFKFCNHEQPCHRPECQRGLMIDEEFAKTCPPEPPTMNAPVDMQDWVPEMGWEEEDYWRWS